MYKKLLLEKLESMGFLYKIDETNDLLDLYFRKIDKSVYEGFLSIYKTDNELKTLSVPVDFQNKGIGTLMLHYALEEGVNNLVCESCEKGLNYEQLISFYKKYGFTIHKELEKNRSAFMVLPSYGKDL
ncbi:GNAT family N-acetyltransferase [Enterococcus faecalis]|uniref:GNAT family N-acetyltransferase n=1 Tax=Enterococcus faecalis TaxID=1351 RepID=UPI001A962FB9|nr:GNAT family N-acetyltransferase [Enterococcus faecalis]MBO1137686.1 GNAT family N-acetyltransferase [Enterococcus faecalis]